MENKKTEKEYQARVVVKLTDAFAKAVNKDGLQYSKDTALDSLKEALAEHKADLHNAMRDFEYYVQSSEAHGVDDNPIVNWTRDATENPHATARYSTMFTVAIAGKKVFDTDQAEKLKKSLDKLSGNGVVELVKVDSMNPAKNPPIPKRYFKP